jgi:LmbE family N-acetylglucosaminyl deacetylase
MFGDLFRAPRKVVAVFAHPDDAELACFGTLCLLRDRGTEIALLVATNGETTGAPEAGYRAGEAALASSMLGAKLDLLELPDGNITFDAATVTTVEDALGQAAPDVVITHFPQEGGFGHQDHATLAHVVTNVALRRHPMASLVYAEPPVLGYRFEPNLYVDVTSCFDRKLAAIDCHRTERAKSFVDGALVRERAKLWALRALGSREAIDRRYEAFVVVKGMAVADR